MNEERGAFTAGNLTSPRMHHSHTNEDPTTEIPLEDHRQVQFADRSPSIIPSYMASEQGSVLSSPLELPPQLSSPQYRNMHQSSYEAQSRAAAFNTSNSLTDTFQPGKTLIEKEDDHEMQIHNNNMTAVYDPSNATRQGYQKLQTTDSELQDPPGATQQRGLGNAPRSYKGNKSRGPLMRLLLGPVSRPWFSWLSGLGMLVALIVEFVKNHELTGAVIETSPFNPMIGPSFTVLINLGAKFSPCMRTLPDPTLLGPYASCFTDTATCMLEQLCGFGGFGPSGVPDQSFRFFTAIFLHAGIIHYLMNMLTHMGLGADLERELGMPRYVLLYIASGLWGNVLSAMLAQSKQATMGCSGALFGLIGYMFIDLIVNWKATEHPVRELMKLLVSTIVSLVLGLLPGLDNFAHLGGFCVGLLMGVLITPMRSNASPRAKWIMWGARALSLIFLIILFAVTITSFYNSPDPSKICPGCKYLSCLPVNGWCDM